jgi:predicted transcriptional regulator
MSSDESSDDGQTAPVSDRLEAGADRAVTQLDDGLVDLLAWVLDTETRARIYVYLRQAVWSTSGEVAEGTGLYPSTVREALAALHEEDIVERRKRESAGAGNNPYEYAAIAPADLVSSIVEEVQSELNTVFNLDDLLGGKQPTSSPVSITVEEANPDQAESDD